MLEAIINAGIETFKTKVKKELEKLEYKKLTISTSEQVEIALEKSLCEAGIASYKEYLKMHDDEEKYIDREGKRYYRKMASRKTFLTPFGNMELERQIYQSKDGKSIIPLDEKWGMKNEFATSKVRESICYAIAHLTQKESYELLEKCCLYSPSEKAIRNVVSKVSDFAEQHKDEVENFILEEDTIPDKTHTIVASLDGVNVLLNEKGAQRGRPKTRPDKMSDVENKTCCKNAMVASISCYDQKKDGEKTPQRLSSKYLARMPEHEFPTLKSDFEERLSKIHLQTSEKHNWVLLMDGQRSLWNYVTNTSLFDRYEKLIDFFHVTEHLAKASEAIFGSCPNAQKWYFRYRKLLLECSRAPSAIIASIDYYLKAKKLSKKKLDALAAERTFFYRNSSKMLYSLFLKRGLPIGSGPVEAACKTIVKTRLARSGMKWTRNGGQKILNLRCYVKSNQWDLFWSFYKSQSQNVV